MLCLADGVLAVGRRAADAARRASRASPSGCSRRARRACVLAVPIAQDRATMHLDTICTMVDRDAVVMYPQVADTLTAFTLTPDGARRRAARRSSTRRPTRWGSAGCA